MSELESLQRRFEVLSETLQIRQGQFDQAMAMLEAERAAHAAAREDVADLTWISANLNRDAQGNDVPFIVSTVMQDVLLHCPPMGSKYPHLRAAVRAARAGGGR